MTLTVTQFLHPPNAEQQQVTTVISDTCQAQVDLILHAGCRFTIEQLSTGHISAAIEFPDLGDFALSLTANGPEIKPALEKMIDKWKQMQSCE